MAMPVLAIDLFLGMTGRQAPSHVTFTGHASIFIPFQLNNNPFIVMLSKFLGVGLVTFIAISSCSPDNQLFRITLCGVFLNSLQFYIPLHEQLSINFIFAFEDFSY